MKKTIKLAVVAALALGTTSAFATNGTGLIGYGAKSRAMGGAAISNYNGAESAFANPALITSAKNTTDATIGATILMPEVTFKADAYGTASLSRGTMAAATSNDSTAGDGMIPSVAVINKVSDSFSWALALYGVGGMGVDYRITTPNSVISGMGANDSLMLMRMSIPLAYSTNGFSIGIAPVIEYGSLAIGTMDGSTPLGVTSDIATGFELGATYSIAGFSMGIDYKSAVTHDFTGTFTSQNPTTGAMQNDLDTPSVMGLGLSYSMSEHTLAFDYKTIAYSSAAGLEDFGWEDQNIMSIGYEYATDSWAARVGYNLADSPLPTEITNAASYAQVSGSMMMFPGVTESHITFGGSYNFSKVISVDLAYMLATGSASATIPAAMVDGTNTGTIEAINDQTSLSFALNYSY